MEKKFEDGETVRFQTVDYVTDSGISTGIVLRTITDDKGNMCVIRPISYESGGLIKNYTHAFDLVRSEDLLSKAENLPVI